MGQILLRFNLWAVRRTAKMGAEAFTGFGDSVRRAAARSDRNAHAYASLLRQVCHEQIQAKRFDVAAAVSAVAVDICRPRGVEFELELALALYDLGYSRYRGDEAAVDVLTESVELMARHLSDNPTVPSVYASALGLLAIEQSLAGRYTEAVDTAKKALATQGEAPELDQSLVRLRELFTSEGRVDELAEVEEEIDRRAGRWESG